MFGNEGSVHSTNAYPGQYISVDDAGARCPS